METYTLHPRFPDYGHFPHHHNHQYLPASPYPMSSNGHANSTGVQVAQQSNGSHLLGQNNANAPPRRRTVRDYQFGTRIGEGSYSTVYLAVDLYNKRTYAVKMLLKKHIVQEGKTKYVNIEKTTLHRLGVQHPGIVQLYYTFQDELSLFFVLDFAEYGELLSIISKFGSLLEQVLKFYMLQILDAVKFIHLKGVIHRDLKPENILVGYDFNLKITDFGAAKLLGDDDDNTDDKITYDSVNDASQSSRLERKGSFVGTAEYVPPELLKYNLCGFETDIWAIACILFQFFNGVPPFKGATEYLTFEKIISIDYSFKEPVPHAVKEIIEKILVFEPQKRPTISEIQAMPWFKGVPWNNREYIWNRKVPRFEPYNQNASSTSGPHMKTGANRNFNKSNSNYQLHSQIQKFDNLVPSFESKPLYLPATRLKKGLSSQNVNHSAMQQGISHNLPPQQNPPQLMRQGSDYQAHDHQYNLQMPPPHSHQRQKANQNGYRQMIQNSSKGQVQSHVTYHQQSPQTYQQLPNLSAQHQQQQSNSYIAAQQAAAQMSPLEKTFAETKIRSNSNSPELNNLRANTAFASLPRQASPKVKAPAAAFLANANSPVPKSSPPIATRSPSASKPTSKPSVPTSKPIIPAPKPIAPLQTATRSSQPIKLAESAASVKTATKKTVTITLNEISSFLDPGEKIMKLDSVLKLMLSNKLINRKPGTLDDEAIELLIGRHQTILDEKMVPVIACISNKAKVFLIDDNLDVMMVDLTANKGSDYLMYDYEFESLLVDDEDDPHGTDLKEEVFGYLILELIKEGGDLIFLKRFSEVDKGIYLSSIKVVGTTGQPMKIGGNFGWIDCLMKAKEMVDQELKEKNRLNNSSRSSSQHRQNTPPAKSNPSSARPSRNSSTTKLAAKPKTKVPAKTSTKPLAAQKSASEKKTGANNFAFAAAAAAHK